MNNLKVTGIYRNSVARICWFSSSNAPHRHTGSGVLYLSFSYSHSPQNRNSCWLMGNRNILLQAHKLTLTLQALQYSVFKYLKDVYKHKNILVIMATQHLLACSVEEGGLSNPLGFGKTSDTGSALLGMELHCICWSLSVLVNIINKEFKVNRTSKAAAWLAESFCFLILQLQPRQPGLPVPPHTEYSRTSSRTTLVSSVCSSAAAKPAPNLLMEPVFWNSTAKGPQFWRVSPDRTVAVGCTEPTLSLHKHPQCSKAGSPLQPIAQRDDACSWHTTWEVS